MDMEDAMNRIVPESWNRLVMVLGVNAYILVEIYFVILWKAMVCRTYTTSYVYIRLIISIDDMPAHIKSTLIGASITVPLSGGKLNLGTWQGTSRP
jgi:thiamine phosphate synthase YjbQ (UPF0047 family)